MINFISNLIGGKKEDNEIKAPTDESATVTNSPSHNEGQEQLGIRSLKKNAKEETMSTIDSQKLARLNFLLERSSIYSKFLSEKLDKIQKEKASGTTEIQLTPTPKSRKKAKTSTTTSTKVNQDGVKIDPRQPKLLTGAVLKDYQIEGVEWLISLYDNGLNGILADEMGLGKTIQTIGFISYLIEQGVKGPFIIVVPLSTINNWENEFKRFAPSIDTLVFYGNKEERMFLRKRHFSNKKPDFAVNITSYEIAMKDRTFLQRFAWKYLVVDEGHRLKNFDCKLSKELKKIGAANRLLLTGTPLHNDLTELWSLLNFILPDIFDDMSSFVDWFDFSNLGSAEDDKLFDESKKKDVISKLHSILKPFLLRRLKVDVERSLPKKREYILNAYLTEEQKKLYEAILNNKLRETLIEMDLLYNPEPVQIAGTKRIHDQSQDHDENDFDSATPPPPLTARQISTSIVNQMHLLNKIMQLRKVCNHPYSFNAPYDPETGEYIYDPKAIVNHSGKMLLLDKLIKSLISKGHKVLIFSQFTHVLDILETYILEIGKWEYCRIDGSVTQDSRQEQIQEFNTNPEFKVFLLSTRAGGLGINLASADSVIFFDSDWNPQMDLQAQDRAHRIGQTRPVIVYRLITANTVESILIGQANSKRLLEKLVIHKSKFKGLRNIASLEEDFGEEFHRMVYNQDYEDVIIKPGDEVIDEAELARIMDRSDEAFEQASQILKESKKSGVPTSSKGVYQLYETLQGEENQFSLQDDKIDTGLVEELLKVEDSIELVETEA